MAPQFDTKVEANPSRTSKSSSQQEKETSPQAPSSNEYADAEENFDVKSLKFWLIIISVYLCFFLIALDRMIIGKYLRSPVSTKANTN